MLTVIIRASDDPAPLVESLTPLVAGAVTGQIGTVFVISAKDEMAHVADEAGAAFINASDWLAGLREACSLARSRHLIAINSGTIVDELFFPALDRHFRQYGTDSDHVAATRPARRNGIIDRGLRSLTGRVRLDQVIIAPKSRIRESPWETCYGRDLRLIESWSHMMRER